LKYVHATFAARIIGLQIQRMVIFMKKHVLFSSTILTALLVLAGCGRNLTGNYNSTVNLSTLNAGCSTNSVSTNIIINANSSTVTGSWSSSCMNATFTGTDNGQGVISNVIATVTPVNSQAYGNTGSYYGYSSNCVYNGTLNSINNTLSGTLQLQQAAQTTPGYNSNAACSTSLFINGQRSN
jgi:hypothetical protein